MITVIDYGIGNIGSIMNMLRKVGADCITSSDPDEIKAAQKLILPGVGSFDAGMRALTETGIAPAIKAATSQGTTTLGICLGMQLMCDKSEEGELLGLGIVPGHCKKFEVEKINLRVPHMGWNIATPTKDAYLFDPEESELRYYFVHSYHFVCKNDADIAATTTYGIPITCSFQHKNIYGVQFHPEKSHRFGSDMFKRFAGL